MARGLVVMSAAVGLPISGAVNAAPSTKADRLQKATAQPKAAGYDLDEADRPFKAVTTVGPVN